MASNKRHPRYRAATFTLAYVCLCVAGVLTQVAVSRIIDAESTASDAASEASETFSRIEQNEDDISELRDTVENMQIQMEYR